MRENLEEIQRKLDEEETDEATGVKKYLFLITQISAAAILNKSLGWLTDVHRLDCSNLEKVPSEKDLIRRTSEIPLKALTSSEGCPTHRFDFLRDGTCADCAFLFGDEVSCPFISELLLKFFRGEWLDESLSRLKSKCLCPVTEAVKSEILFSYVKLQ